MMRMPAERREPVLSGSLFGRLLLYVAMPGLAGAAIGYALLLSNDGDDGPPVAAANVGFADAVERAAPAVVNIYSVRARRSICDLPQYRAFCQRLGVRQRGRPLAGSLGSGVIVREDGYIVTNHHVIAGGDDIVVQFSKGGEARATVVGTDRETDLAVIKVEGTGYPTLAPAAAVRVGDIVLAIGNPFGIGQAGAAGDAAEGALAVSVSQGIVSAKGRERIAGNPYHDFIQTDAAVNPGNSGGALVDVQGRLVGINTLIYSQGGGSDGVGFAIPVERAMDVLEDIISHGRALRGWLGALLGPSATGTGLDVLAVYRDTPAARAGLLPGDVLLSVNGESAASGQALSHWIAAAEPNSRLSIRIRRNGAVRVLEAIAGVRPTD